MSHVLEPPAIFSLPTEGGIPVLSPLQQVIEQRETLSTLRGQLDKPVGQGQALRSALRTLDLLLHDES